MIITNAVLHILDKSHGEVVMMEDTMSLGQSGIHEYIESVVESLSTGEIKTGSINESEYLSRLLGDGSKASFLEKSTDLAKKLFDTIATVEEADSGELLVVEYNEGPDSYLAAIKLNYTRMYVHSVETTGDKLTGELVLDQHILPKGTQKVDEGVIINLTTGEYELRDKRYLIDGHRIFNFSERFLELKPESSDKVDLDSVKSVIRNVSDKYDVPQYEAYTKAQIEIFGQLAEGDIVDVDSVVKNVFAGNVSAQADAKKLLKDKDVEDSIELSNPTKYQKKYQTQRFKVGSGIEFTVPIEIVDDKKQFDITHNEDGTVSIIIKDQDAIINKFTN